MNHDNVNAAPPGQTRPDPDLPPRVMSQLRSATADSHRSVERKTPFFAPKFDLPVYVRWLRDMLGFYTSLERALLGSPLLESRAWAYTPRTPLLHHDLNCLGVEWVTGHTRLAAMPDLSHPLQTAGAMYVIEGSSLGGQVLAARLVKSLGIRHGDGASFFQPNGPHPQEHWARFQALLGRLATDTDAEQALVRGAVEMFNAFDAWLDERGWPHPHDSDSG